MKLFKIGFLLMICSVQLGFAQNEEFVVSPVPPHDTLYKVDKSIASNFSFSGLVKTVSGEIVPTTVTLIDQQTSAEYSATTTSQNNAFTILNIPSGNYILRGVPANYPYITTYFNSSKTQSGAYVFSISATISEVQLYLLEQVVTQADQNNTNVSLDIFPNPFDQRLTINTTTGKEIKIFNLSGKLLATANNDNETIDTSQWDSGLYLIQLQNGTVLKFTKM